MITAAAEMRTLFSRYVRTFCRTKRSRILLGVGEKIHLGGIDSNSDFVLNAPKMIHKMGRKKKMAISHSRT
jgi:hypothetical protein